MVIGSSNRLTEIAIIGDYHPTKSEAMKAQVADFSLRMTEHGVKVHQYNRFMTVEAIQMMRLQGYIAVLPSLYDNTQCSCSRCSALVLL